MKTFAVPNPKNFQISIKIKDMLTDLKEETVGSTANYILEQDKIYLDLAQFMIVHQLSHSTQRSKYLRELLNRIEPDVDIQTLYQLTQRNPKNAKFRTLLSDYENKLSQEFLEAIGTDNLDLYTSLDIELSSKAQKIDEIITDSSTNFITNRLTLAASLNSIKIFNFLITNGAVPNKFTFEAAVKGASMELFRLVYNRKMVTPMTIKRSFENVHSEIPRFLIQELRDYNPNYLILAIENYHFDLFIEIWNECISKSTFTPSNQLIFEAVSTRNIDVLRFLTEEQRMDLNAINSVNGDSLIFEACRVDSARMVKYLIVQGADPCPKQGNAPINAAENNRNNVLSTFFQHISSNNINIDVLNDI